MATAKKPAAKKPAQQFVTKEEFNELQSSIGDLVGLVKQSMAESAEAKTIAANKVEETPLEKEVTKARPDYVEPVNPEWQDKAEEILGDALDHIEAKHLRTGGLIFTVVIKKEKSNASESYLAEFKTDRRSKEIGAEGIGGVENWCKLIKQNLARPRSTQQLTN